MYISKEDFMTADLTGICRINAIDYSDYIAEKSHDGGHYAFYTTFVKEEYDRKKLVHHVQLIIGFCLLPCVRTIC